MRLTTVHLLLSAGCAALLALGNQPAAASVTTLIDNGDPSNRVDVVFLGDGYTQTDLDNGVYDTHVQSYVDHQFGAPAFLADPFPRYKKFFNVHQVEVVSNESGADRPPLNDFRDTALDAKYWWDGVTERLLYVDASKANAARNAALAGTGITADMQYVTINDTKYGGGGGSWAVFAGGNSNAHDVALHEVGHSFSSLADEYEGDSGSHSPFEPFQANITVDPTGAKWAHWLGFDDPRGSNLDIGVFEGAHYFSQDIYRPSSNSKMRSLNIPFNAVSREKIILDIYDDVDPIDEHLDNSLTLFDPDELWVDVVDTDVILLEWTVDGILTAVTDEMFDIAAAGLGLGDHIVVARAYDGVLDHVGDESLLDLVRKDFGQLEQTIAWNITISVPEPSAVWLVLSAMLLAGKRSRIAQVK